MINHAQNERMIAKVAGLTDYYGGFEVIKKTPIADVLFSQKRDGETAPPPRAIRNGETWGGDFVYATFTFTLKKAAVLEIDNGAPENTVFCDGAPVGLTDYTAGVRTPNERLHRYIGVPAGKITVEGYAGHTYYGTMPRDGKQTFFFTGYMPTRTYGGIYAVTFDEPLRTFDFLLGQLNACYRAQADAFYHAGLTDVYHALFDVMPLSRRPTEDEVARGTQILKAFFDGQQGGEKPYVGAIGHSHLDTAWLWPVAETKRKALRTASNAVQLLKKYPDYRFLMSSVLYYDWFRQYPDFYRDVCALVESGRWETTAGWVECDCNLTGAEALCRQFARGARFQKQQFGKTPEVFWLPDTFGYSAALPQIMRLSGVQYFLTTKLSWNDTNRFPYDTFVWRGLDGSAVKVHFNSTHTRLDPTAVSARCGNIVGKHYAPYALMAYGYGDGGAGPNEDMVREALLCERYPAAKVEHTSVQAFMERLPDELPVWNGELYLELHRGTLTGRHDLKKYNRLLENALHAAEFVGALTGTGKETTDRAYDTLMLSQFHDILPGTSIACVNDEAEADLRGALDMLDEFMVDTLGRGDLPLNTLSFPVSGYVLATDRPSPSYIAPDGKTVSPVRVDMPAWGTGRIVAQPSPPVYADGVIETPFYTAKIGESGLSSLVYEGREIACGVLGKMTVGEDLPLLWDNWDIDADQALKRRAAVRTELTHFTCGGLLVVRETYRIADKSTLTRDIVFNASDPLIRFDTAVDWQDDHTLLTVEFETDLFSPQVRSEVQFGFIDRSVYNSTPTEQAAFEYVNHRWSELREDTLACTLINDCKYGVHCDGGTLGLSLIKSGTHPDERGERGVKSFSYAICVRAADTAETVRTAAAFNMRPPFVEKTLRAPFAISSPSVVCETVKLAEDGGIAFRLYECARKVSPCRIDFDTQSAFFESDIPELSLTPIGQGTTLEMTFRPFEIKTIVVKPL